jgi:hypothetical protein
MDESPWGDLRGKPLDARGLSRRLSKYDDNLRPQVIRIGEHTIRGYESAGFADLWQRYLPPPDADDKGGKGGEDEEGDPAGHGPVTDVTSDTDPPAATAVTDVTHPPEANRFGTTPCVMCGVEMGAATADASGGLCSRCRIVNREKAVS